MAIKYECIVFAIFFAGANCPAGYVLRTKFLPGICFKKRDINKIVKRGKKRKMVVNAGFFAGAKTAANTEYENEYKSKFCI